MEVTCDVPALLLAGLASGSGWNVNPREFWLLENMNEGKISKRDPGAVNGKGGRVKGRPIAKSEFRQIPPNRLQLMDRITLRSSARMSTIGQSCFMERDVRCWLRLAVAEIIRLAWI
jgi:hypothetical protein